MFTNKSSNINAIEKNEKTDEKIMTIECLEFGLDADCGLFVFGSILHAINSSFVFLLNTLLWIIAQFREWKSLRFFGISMKNALNRSKRIEFISLSGYIVIIGSFTLIFNKLICSESQTQFIGFSKTFRVCSPAHDGKKYFLNFFFFYLDLMMKRYLEAKNFIHFMRLIVFTHSQSFSSILGSF